MLSYVVFGEMFGIVKMPDKVQRSNLVRMAGVGTNLRTPIK